MLRLLRCGIYLLAFPSAALAIATLVLWAHSYWRMDYIIADGCSADRAVLAEDDWQESWRAECESAQGRLSLDIGIISESWYSDWCGVVGPPPRPDKGDVQGEFHWSRGASELLPPDSHAPGTFWHRLGFGETNNAHFFDRGVSWRFALIRIPHWAAVLGFSILPGVLARSRLRKRRGRGFQVETRDTPTPNAIATCTPASRRSIKAGIRFAIRTFSCFIPLLALSCSNLAPWQRMSQNSDLGTGIASVGGMDKPAQAHIETLLLQHGIHCGMEGSIIYGVWVAPKDAPRALRVLRQDLKRHPFDITLWEGDVGEQYSSPGRQRYVVEPAMKYEELLRSPDSGPNTDLGAALRYPAVREASRTFPYLITSTIEEPHTDWLGHRYIGHDIELIMYVTAEEEIGYKCVWLRAWDQGRHVEFADKSECWIGDEATVAMNRKKYDRRH